MKSERTLLASIESVEVLADHLTAHLTDGRVVSVPITWYPRLVHATETERSNWRLIGSGEGIRWPDLDEDISVENIVFGEQSGESQESLQSWLRAREPRD